MRQIKFRGKRVDNGEWVYGSLLQSEEDTQGNIECLIVQRFADELELDKFYVIPETVGQFTGFIIDEGLTPIYEGDFVKCDEEIMLVGWNKKFASFCLDKNGWAFSHWFGEAVDADRCEVIGNIHDKPRNTNPTI